MSTFEIIINGRAVKAGTGQTILEAAKAAGIEIPTLCHHAKLANIGACRMCVVEVDGQRRPVPSCTTPAEPGMVVRTDTPGLWDLRRQVTELLFSERNHICPFCTRSGHCELQNMGYRVGMTHVRYKYLHPVLPVDLSHEHIGLDHNRCILCSRCVRVCDERVGVHTLDLMRRGGDALVVADHGIPLGESTCISCGACVDVCPTGSLFEKRTSHWRRRAEVDRVRTICPSCDVGCAIDAASQSGGVLLDVRGGDGPANDGLLCRHGRFGLTAHRKGRIDGPRLRQSGALVPCDESAALDRIVQRLRTGAAASHPERVAGAISSRLPMETLGAFRVFMRDIIRTPHFGVLDGPCRRAFREGLDGAFDNLALMQDLDAADLFVLAGADPDDIQGVVGEAIRRGVYHRRAGLVEIAHSATPLAEIATHAFEIPAGSDGPFLRSLLKALAGYKAVRDRLGEEKAAAAGKIDDGDAERLTGIEGRRMRVLSGILAAARHPVLIVGTGLARQGANIVRDAVNLAVALGADSRSGRLGLMILGDTANGRAAALLDMDGFDPAAFDAHAADVFFLLLGDDATALPPGFLEELRAVPQTVLFASHERELAAVADVIFPAPAWAERWGTCLTLEGRVQQAAAVVKPPEGVREEREILRDLARRLGGDAALDRTAILPEVVRNTSPGELVVTGRSAADLDVALGLHREETHRG